jgi:hypothetical protein
MQKDLTGVFHRRYCINGCFSKVSFLPNSLSASLVSSPSIYKGSEQYPLRVSGYVKRPLNPGYSAHGEYRQQDEWSVINPDSDLHTIQVYEQGELVVWGVCRIEKDGNIITVKGNWQVRIEQHPLDECGSCYSPGT